MNFRHLLGCDTIAFIQNFFPSNQVTSRDQFLMNPSSSQMEQTRLTWCAVNLPIWAQA